MSDCVVMGNGPSGALYNGVIDYACNVSGVKHKPRKLVAVDPWLQFDIISTNYAGACYFLNFDPLPIEIPIDFLYQSGSVPADYDVKIHNPEIQENAVSWYFYATGDMQSDAWARYTKDRPDYWRSNRVYVCYIPATMNIHNIEPIESGESRLAPTGAYALHLACHEADTVDIYGFDSIAGSMGTESNYDPAVHGQTQADHFTDWYKKIMAKYSEVEFKWHTRG